MKKDIEISEVKDVFIAAVLDQNENQEDAWLIYLINDLGVMIEGVMVTSKGYDLKETNTSTLRHRIGNIPYKTSVKVELITQEVFKLFNEYWVTFFQEGKLMEKKFTFGPHTIDKEFLEDLPVMGQKGIIVK